MAAPQHSTASHGKKKPFLLRFWKLLGPGLITGASDDDPSGITTYTQAGARFGLATLWASLAAFPLMYVVQEMCARIGLVTNRGLAGVVKDHYPRWVLYGVIAFSCPAILLNISADIAGMGAVANLIFPQVPATVFSLLFTVLLSYLMIVLPYRRLAAIMKYLCLVLLVYLIVPFLSHQHVGDILRHTFVPQMEFSREFLLVLVGVLGTTISPYLFFWQTAMEVEEMHGPKKAIVLDKFVLPRMHKDVGYGMFFSVLVMYFITLTAGSVLHENGITQIETVEDAALALRPLAGNFSYALFALGVIGTGLLAVPVLAGSLSYIIAETFGWQEGLNKKFHQAREFYFVIIIATLLGLGINFTGIGPVKALLYTAVLYGITAPVLIGVILHICNNPKIMQTFTNGRLTNILGVLTLLLMGGASVLLIVLMF